MNRLRAWRWFRAGQRYQQQGACRKAAALYQRAIDLNGRDAGAWLWRGLALGECGRFTEAREHIERGATLSRRAAGALFQARILYDSGEFERARTALAPYARENQQAAALAALCLFRAGEQQKAREILKTSLPHAPWLLARLLLAVEEKSGDASEEPAAALPEIPAPSPDSGWFGRRAGQRSLRRGLLYLRAGKPEKAFAAFADAYRWLAGDARVAYGLGTSLYFLNHAGPAQEWLLKAYDRLEEPFVTDAQATLGKAALELGDAREAILRLRRAIAAGAAEPENYYALGAAFLRAGRPAPARRAFERCATAEFARERLDQLAAKTQQEKPCSTPTEEGS